jgi:protein gp37
MRHDGYHCDRFGNENPGLNCIIGCKSGGFSRGCRHCLALNSVFRAQGNSHYRDETRQLFLSTVESCKKKQWNGHIEFRRKVLKKMCAAKRPTNYLISFLSDVGLIEKIDQLKEIWETIEKYPQHHYTFLTKVPDELASKFLKISNGLPLEYRPNVSIAVSVEDAHWEKRIKGLRRLAFANLKKEVWFEPLVGEPSDNLDLRGISAVTVGFEKASKVVQRFVNAIWKEKIRKVCERDGVEFQVADEKRAELLAAWKADDRRHHAAKSESCQASLCR